MKNILRVKAWLPTKLVEEVKDLVKSYINLLSANHPKMIKHIQTIPWQIADELFECVWPFWGVGA